MGVLNYQRAPALLISMILFVAVAVSYLPMGFFINFNIKKTIGINFLRLVKFGHLIVLLAIYFGFFLAICKILGNDFDTTVMKYIGTYFAAIVATTYILLEGMPYFVNIFENTLGYLFLQFFRKDNPSMFNRFKFDLNVGNKIAPESTDKEFLITVMDILKENTWLPDITDEIKKSLYAKHFVGHFVWVYFACLICTFTIIKTMAYNA